MGRNCREVEPFLGLVLGWEGPTVIVMMDRRAAELGRGIEGNQDLLSSSQTKQYDMNFTIRVGFFSLF